MYTQLGNWALHPKVSLSLGTNITFPASPVQTSYCTPVCLYGFSSITPGCETVPRLQDLTCLLPETNGLGSLALPENVSSAENVSNAVA